MELSERLTTLIEKLVHRGWKLRELPQRRRIPVEVTNRYPWMPAEFRDFAEQVDVFSSGDDKTWLLTVTDFDNGNAFAWNEWEKQSLEAAVDDVDWVRRIGSFWDEHLPVLMSVRSGYAYCALSKSNGVVFGEEPEFEDVISVASSSSFSELLSLLSDVDGRLKRIVG
jgi:hypothetical protein